MMIVAMWCDRNVVCDNGDVNVRDCEDHDDDEDDNDDDAIVMVFVTTMTLLLQT